MRKEMCYGVKHIILIFVFFFLLLCPSIALAKEPATIVLINQVRGTECCDPGSLDHTKQQLETLNTLNMSATFALRFDALQNESFVRLFSESKNLAHETALFLEITPELAKRAGVTYRGPVERWYKAGSAYLVGYAPDDRKKIIDAAVSEYKAKLGSYPKTTVAWIIDSESLQYLQGKYGVSAHEITREQWSTDSYTLYGGPVNVPYFPSVRWPLVPAQEDRSASTVLILRQTVMDPLRTYGDFESIYTSQPNDYMKGRLDHKYFEELLSNILKRQLPFGFGVIGLENSMAKEFQDEYVKQLQTIKKLKDEGKLTTHAANQYRESRGSLVQKFPVSLWYSDVSAEGHQAFWITTDHYRVRFLRVGESMLLTDFRVYADTLTDPYAQIPSALNAYWIVPFMLDASRYSPKASSQSSGILSFSSQTSKKKSGPIQQDFEAEPRSAGFLPQMKKGTTMQVESNPGTIRLSYETAQGKPVRIEAATEKLTIFSDPSTRLEYDIISADLQRLIGNGFYTWNNDIVLGKATFEPGIQPNASMSAMRAEYPHELHPESAISDVSLSHSVKTLVNSTAIIGRNPVRLMLYLRNPSGKPTVSEHIEITTKEGDLNEVFIQHPETSQGEYFIDLTKKSPGRVIPTVIVDGQDYTFPAVRFVTDCKSKVLDCLRRPNQIYWYLRTKIEDKIQTSQNN